MQKDPAKFNASVGYIVKFKKVILGHFLFKNPGARIFPKESFELILSLYALLTSCKKSKKFHALTFNKT